ncbi:hypothetical protein, partial [Fulvimarina sp. MAC8]|uniref:hypothetical protein n=1 Tax=Fulvimarina sp. MAC8 TaxID=3162874 RepID=UPI0032ECAE08
MRRLERIKRRVGECLEPVLYRELGAEEASRALSNQAVARSIDEGYALGFRSEHSLYQWSLLQTSSAGELGKDPRIGQYLRSERTGLSAEERLDAVFKRLAHLSAAHGGLISSAKCNTPEPMYDRLGCPDQLECCVAILRPSFISRKR